MLEYYWRHFEIISAVRVLELFELFLAYSCILFHFSDLSYIF